MKQGQQISFDTLHFRNKTVGLVEAIPRAMTPLVATPHGGDRSKSESFALGGKEQGKTSDKIGAFAGMSGRTVEKIAKVVKAAKAETNRNRSLQNSAPDRWRGDQFGASAMKVSVMTTPWRPAPKKI
jgi:hypothetical protein